MLRHLNIGALSLFLVLVVVAPSVAGRAAFTSQATATSGSTGKADRGSFAAIPLRSPPGAAATVTSGSYPLSVPPGSRKLGAALAAEGLMFIDFSPLLSGRVIESEMEFTLARNGGKCS